MKRPFLPLLLALTLLAAALPAFALNEWTVLLYLVSEDNEKAVMLESHRDALDEMARQAGVTGSYEVLVLIDCPKGKRLFSTGTKAADGAFRLEPGRDGRWAIDSELGEVNMGNPHTLYDFLRWAAQEHPARHQALFIAAHGSGIFSWRGTGNVSSFRPGTVDFDPGRFVAYDDSDDDCLTVFELQAVLAAAKQRLYGSRPLDVIVFDSCLPGGVEAIYQLRDVVEIMVSSPSTTYIGGMPYGRLVRNLAARPAMDAAAFGTMVAKTFVDNAFAGQVMGVFRPGASQELVSALENLSIELVRVAQESGRFPLDHQVEYGSKKRYWDLGLFLQELVRGRALNAVAGAERVRVLAREALAALEQNRLVVEFCGEFERNGVSGLSVAWPARDELAKWGRFYGVLDFARVTHWDEFLAAWHAL